MLGGAVVAAKALAVACEDVGVEPVVPDAHAARRAVAATATPTADAARRSTG
jgi:hypothetical protein